MQKSQFLCEYTDPMTNSSFRVEIDYFDIIGQSRNIVYKGQLLTNDGKKLQDVAIKQISIKEGSSEISEAEILRALNENDPKKTKNQQLHHENIVQLYHTFHAPKTRQTQLIFLVMEYCPSMDLKNYLRECDKKGQMVNDWQIRDFFRQAVKGLNYMHSKSIIHRDIKPQNLLLTDENKRLKIADYDISRYIPLDLDKMTMYKGTQHYMAPEVISEIQRNQDASKNSKVESNCSKKADKGYSYPADIFSLGVTLYYMYFKEEPWFLNSPKNSPEVYISEIYKKVIRKGMDIFPEHPEIPLSAKKLILRMLDLDQNTRIKLGDILRDPYLLEKPPIIADPSGNEAFERLVAETNRLLLINDLMGEVHRLDFFCRDKLLWLKALIRLCRMVKLKSKGLFQALQEENKDKLGVRKEKWNVFYDNKVVFKTVIEKIKLISEVSEKNLAVLTGKIKENSEFLEFDKDFMTGVRKSLRNLMKQYRASMQKEENVGEKRLLMVVYKLAAVLENLDGAADEGFRVEKFLERLEKNIVNNKRLIMGRIEDIFKRFLG